MKNTGVQTNGGHEGTRDRILRLLMESSRSARALAAELGITENAVRSQIALLQSEGVVDVQGEIKGSRRPAAVFGLRPGAELRFSRAYPLAFSSLVRVLSERLPDREIRAIMRELGLQIAGGQPRFTGEARARVAAAQKVLQALGSAVHVTEEKGRMILSSDSCPIAEAVRVDERSCLSVASMLQHLTGLRVAERCSHGTRPACRFEVELPAGE